MQKLRALGHDLEQAKLEKMEKIRRSVSDFSFPSFSKETARTSAPIGEPERFCGFVKDATDKHATATTVSSVIPFKYLLLYYQQHQRVASC